MIEEMGADEISAWMAYELSNTPEFQDYLDSIPIELPPEEEAKAIKKLLMGLSK